MPEKIETICSRLLRECGSHERLGRMLDLLADEGPATAWGVFHREWSGCDDTWPHRARLRLALKQWGGPLEAVRHLPPEDLPSFEALPDRVQLFRGCSAWRATGFAWSTSEDVARRFARGHRGIGVPSPVLASVVVSKGEVFGFYTERGESEAFIDGGAVWRGMSIEPLD